MTTAASSDEARRAAAEILRERRFQPDRQPRPLQGVITWFGDRLRWFGRPFGWIWRQLNTVIPGGGNVVWIALTVLGLAVVCVLIFRYASWRGRRAASAADGSTRLPTADELDRLAAEAEARGDYSSSVRLRFRAGLRRLAEVRAVRTPEQRPNADLVSHLADPSFATLAGRFDEVAYAGFTASSTDADSARRAWPGVVASGVERARELRFPSSAVPAIGSKRRWWRRLFRRGPKR